MTEYPVVFEQNTDGRWTVTCPILPGCISEGVTKEEARHHITEAILLYRRALRKELAVLRHHGAQTAIVAV